MISCGSYDFSSVFSTFPENPKAGKSVTILYNSNGTILDGTDKLYAIVRTYGKRNFQPASMFSMPNNVVDTEEYKMEKRGDGWTVQISTPDSVVGFVVTLHNENDTDFNGGLGYWVPLYTDDQQILPGAEAGYAASLVRRGWGAQLDKTLFADTLLGFYENEFSRNPEKMLGFAFSYFSVLRKSLGTDGFVEIEKHLESMASPDLWTEEHLFFLSAWYGAVKNQEKADYYKTKSQEKFPMGRWIQREEAGQFYKKVGSGEKKVFLDEFEAKYPDYSGFSYMRGVIIGEYIKEGSYKTAIEYVQSLNDKLWSERPVFYAVNGIEKIGNGNGDSIVEIINKSVDASRQEYEKPSTTKPPLKISTIWQEARATQLAMALDALGVATNLMGNHSDALIYLEEAYHLTNKKQKQINEHFSSVLFNNGSVGRAKETLEKSIGGGVQSPKMEEILKEIFMDTHGSDEDFLSYFSNLKTSAMGNLKAEIKEKLVTEKAPAFTLTDTDGKEISLSNYRGKIVILDFWATWCGPCIKSFPAMKKALTKYKKGNEVKILFVNTRETAKDKLQAVKDLMNENDYPFHVLMDDKDEVYQSFGVSLLPTKVIVDKTGNIRYRSLGFMGETELLDELDALISILKSDDQKVGLSG
jgi:peroxiredoxin